METIKKEQPETVGIPSRAILDFITDLEKMEIPIHSILIARHNKLVVETYFSPYTSTDLHRMFSISKSFVSIAIGLMLEERLLSLDDRIVTYFPDKVPDNVHPWISQMTIRDMLKMQTCYSSTTYKINPQKDWVESFFTTKPSHPPGTLFLYDTSSTHTLGALVERLTQTDLLSFMRKKLLDEIGFSKEAYFLKDPFGVPMGGTGLMAYPLDIMKFAMFLMNNGKTQNTKQLLSADYIKQATSLQVYNQIQAPTLEESKGYGYQFWKTQHNGFACYGMGGQFAICLPEEDLICVTTADTQEIKGGNQFIYYFLYEDIVKKLSDVPLKQSKKETIALNSYLQSLKIKPLEGITNSTTAVTINNQIYNIKEPNSTFTRCKFTFLKDFCSGKFIFYREEKEYIINFGFNYMETADFPCYNQRYAASAVWLTKNTLYIKYHIIDEILGMVHFHFSFQEKEVFIYMKKTIEDSFSEFQGFLTGYKL